MDLALNNFQRLICHKTQPTNQPTNQPTKKMNILVLFICLTVYKLLMGYLMLKFDSFVNAWL